MPALSYVLYGRADRAFGVNTKANASGANIKESDTTAYNALSSSPIRKVVFVSDDLISGVSLDAGTPAAGLGTGADDVFTLASTTSGAGGGVKHHNGRAGIDTVCVHSGIWHSGLHRGYRWRWPHC